MIADYEAVGIVLMVWVVLSLPFALIFGAILHFSHDEGDKNGKM